MTYTVSNGTVTVTANMNDGYGFVNARVNLEANKTYVFNCQTNGVWVSGSADTVEAFLMLNGGYSTFYQMMSNVNYEFTPTVTGTYYLRLDVNTSGKTNTFSNINIYEKVKTESKDYNSTLGTLPEVSRTGYSLAGWYNEKTGGTQISSSTTVPANDVTYYTHWNANTYTVAYNGNGNTGGSTASSTHTYDVAKNLTANGFTRGYTVTYNSNGGNSLSNATATYSFAGWATSASGSVAYANQASVTNLSSTNGATVNLYAKWTSSSVTLPTPTRVGYTFGGWYSDSTLTTSVGAGGASYTPTANINLYAKWTASNYTITFNANGGSVSTTTKSVTYGQTYTDLPTPTRAGYEFKGWYKSFSGTNDLINYGREYMYTDRISIHLSAYMDDWSQYTRAISCTEVGGWNIEPGDSNRLNFAIFDAGYGYKSVLTSVKYTELSSGWHDFDLLFDGSYAYAYVDGVKVGTSAQFQSGRIGYNSTNSIFIGAEAQSYPINGAYDFFTGYIGNIIIKNDSNLIAGTTYNTLTAPAQDLTMYAKWEPVSYTISYNLNGGSVSSTNPTSYTVESNTITLNNPTRNGYTFKGWSGTGLTGDTNTSVTIPKGSTGNRSYTANWTPITYTISYDLKGGSLASGVTNPTTYTIETNNFTLNNPTRTGYTFAGWTGSNGNTPVTSVTIAKGTTGNKSYTANWTPISYTISYDLAGGSLASGVTNPTSYTIETNTFTLNNPTKRGYTFTGWSGTGLSGSANTSVTIAKGSTGNRSYSANWSANTYEIEYYSNLITNGQFANGLNGWANNVSGTGTVDTSVKYNSQNSIRVSTTGSSFDGICTSYNVDFKPSTTYKITLMAYRDSSSSNGDIARTFRVYLPEYDSSNSLVKWNHNINITTSNLPDKTWQEYTTTFTTDANSASFGGLHADFQAGSGNSCVWLADIRVEEVQTATATYDQNITMLGTSDVTRTGYTCKGWTTKLDGTDDGYNWTGWSGKWAYINGQYGIADGKLKLYARWQDETVPTKPTVAGKFTSDNSDYTSGDWVNREVYTKILSTDEGSGITKIQYSTNGTSGWTDLVLLKSGGIQQSGTTFTGSETWDVINNRQITLYFRAVDASGNASAASEPITIKYDTQKPTAPTLTNTKNGNWTNGNVSITSSSTDNESGVDHYECSYSGNSNTFTKVNNPDGWSAERNEIAYYRAVDKAGNASDASSTAIKIDRTAPTINTGTTVTNITTNSATVTVTATDSFSGFAKVEWWLKNGTGSWAKKGETSDHSLNTATSGATTSQTKTYTFTNIDQATEYHYMARVYDVAGNYTDSSTDGTTPAVTPVTITVESPSTWQTSKSITISANNGNYTQIRYTTNGVDPTPTTGEPITSGSSFTISSNCTIKAIAFDSTNQAGTTATAVVTKIDTSVPVINTVTASSTTDIASFVDFNATDSGSGIVGYNISTSSSAAPTTWIPVVSTVETATETKYEKDSAWARVFHHNSHWGTLQFSTSNNWAEAKSVNTIDKYSVLGDLEKYRNSSNNFEFLLQYPDLSSTEYNRWRQTDNPATVKIANAGSNETAYNTFAGGYTTDFTGGHVDWTQSYWGGLTLSTYELSFINGSVGHGNWFYAIGSANVHAGGIPGPYSGISNVNLWSRIDNLSTTSSTDLTRRLGDLKENTTYYVWVKDEVGHTEKKAITVSNVDRTAPTASITSTNNVATSQTATLNLGDNNGVVKYYFGKSNPTSTNVTWTTITSTTSTAPTATVDSEGTWYLGVQDRAGNRTVTSKTFYKTIFTPNKGSITPAYVITPAGSSFTLPTPSAVTGYTWGGWYKESGLSTSAGTSYTPTADATLYGKWTPVSYSISYTLDGGTLPSGYPTSYTIETNTFSLSNPTKAGYTFAGWTGSNGNTPATSVSITKGSTGNKSYTANWTANTYTVTYNGNGNTGGSTANSTHTYNTAKNLTANGFTKTGYTFAGWSTSSSDKAVISDDTEYLGTRTSSTSGMPVVKQYDVQAPFASGDVYQLEVDVKGSGTLHNYFYGGSNYLKVASVTSSNGQSYTDHTDGHNTFALTSTYTHYTVRFTLGSSGNGNIIKYLLFRIDTGEATAYVKNVRFFKVSSSSTAYANEQSVKNLTTTAGGNVNLYAMWIPNYYTIVYNGNGATGGSTASSVHTYDVAKNLTANGFTRAYTVTYNYNGATGGNSTANNTATYSFAGWATSASGSVAYANQASVTNLATSGTYNLYAKWNSSSVTLPTPTKTGYTFAGWYDAATGGNKIGDGGASYTPTANKELFAQWTANKIKLTLDPNGGTGGTTQIWYYYNTNKFYSNEACTTQITAITRPTRTGYTFVHYYGDGTCGGTNGERYIAYDSTEFAGDLCYDIYKDATLYAKWTPTNYTLTVNPNGGTYNSTTSSSTFTQAYDTVKQVGEATPPSSVTVTFNGNGGTSGSANATSSKSFTGWTLSGTGEYVAASSTSGMNRTLKTENGEIYESFSYTAQSPTSDTWWAIGYPAYTYTSGHTYLIKAKMRVNSVANGGNITFRHSRSGNDWGCPSKGYSSVTNGWDTVELTATISGTTYNLSGTDITISPRLELWTGNLKNTTASMNFDVKDLQIIDVTSDTLLQSNANMYWYRAGNGTLTANYSGYSSVTLPSATREGYTFNGWYDAATGGNKIGDAGASYTPSANKELFAHWTVNQYTVTYEDWFVDSSNNRKVKLGSSTASVNYGTSVSGADKGTDTTTSTYYSAYQYKSSTSATVGTSGATVYRYFWAWTDLNIYYAGGNTQGGATVSFKVGSGSWADVTNESNTIQPWGTTYYVKNIRPVHSYEELDSVGNLTWDATNGYYTYTPTSAGTSMSIYLRYKSYTVTYNYSQNGGTSATKTSDTKAYGSAIDLTPTAAKSGWTFVGWNTNKDATSALSSLSMGEGNVTLYAIFSKTLTGTFYYYNNKSTTSSVTIYNNAGSGSITAPAALGAANDYAFRHWSTSTSADAASSVAASGSITISANTNYYASYQKTITGTFYYCTLAAGDGVYSNSTASSKTATAVQYRGYTGTIVNSNFTVPTEVSSSTGGASAENYAGVATAENSATVVTPTTANTTFYAVYTEPLTFYYYNGSAHTSKTVTRRMLCSSGKYSNSLSETPTPSNYDSGTFANWTYNPNNYGSAYVREPLATDTNTLYARYTRTITATFNYHSGSAAASTTASGTRYYINNPSGGINTFNTDITVPDAAKANRTINSVTYTYRGVSTATTATASVATPTTANTTYYSSYSYPITVSYNGNNATSGTNPSSGSGTGYMNYAGSRTGASITTAANPYSRTGYTYRGWNTDSIGAGTSYSVSTAYTFIDSTTLYADWQGISYTVTYDGNGNTGGSTANSSHVYGAMQELTANGYTRTGYSFEGWNTKADGTGTRYNDKELVKNLTSTSGGIVTLYAQWSEIGYTITYNLNGGTGGLNFGGYSVNTPTFTLNNPTKTGYTFKGWSGTGLTGDTNTTVTIPKGSTGDRTYTANWTAHTYTVAYNGNGNTGGSTASSSHTYGTAKALTANGFTRSYTVTYNYNSATGGNTTTSNTVTYSFNGWNTQANGGGTNYSNQQSVSNLTATNGATFNLYAKWTTTSASVTLPTPTRTGYTFGGWYSDSGLTTSVGAGGASYTPSGSSSTINLYAKWNQVAGVSIIVANADTWRTSKDVTFNATNTNYSTIRYTTNGTTPTTSSSLIASGDSITVSSNCTIKAIAFASGGEAGATATASVTKIDRTIPSINDIPTVVTGTDNAKVTVKVQDSESGLGQIKWQYLLSGSSSGYTTVETSTYTTLNGSTAGATTEQTKTYTFTGLTANTKYTFRALVSDVAGNEYPNAAVSGTTQTVSPVTISVANADTWRTSKTVTFTASNSNYSTIRYTTNGTTPTTSSTSIASGSSITVTSNCTVKAIAFDNSGQAGSTATASVTKVDSTAPTVDTALTVTASASDYITIGCNILDSLSGIGKVEWYYGSNGGNLTLYDTQEYQTINGTTAGTTTQYFEDCYFNNLLFDSTYDFKVIVYDVAGNSVTRTISATTGSKYYTVTANAKDGTIPSTSGWTVASGSATATKSVKYSGTYGTLPTPTKSGFTFDGWYKLPDGFESIEWVGNTSGQYIDTGVIPTANTSIKAKFQVNQDWACIFGAQNTSNENIYLGDATSRDQCLYYYYGNNPNTALPVEFVKGQEYYLETSGANIKIMNLGSANATGGTFSATMPNLYLFARNDNGTAASNTGSQISYFDIYESGTLVRSYVAAKRTSDNVSGLYDLVGKKFYTLDGNSTSYTTGGMITSSTTESCDSDHTIYAKWVKNDTATVTLNRNGGTTGTTSVTATYGETMPSITKPTKSGYTFVGYYSNTSAYDLVTSVSSTSSTERRINFNNSVSSSNGWAMTSSDAGTHLQGKITVTNASTISNLDFNDVTMPYTKVKSGTGYIIYFDFDVSATMVSARSYHYDTTYRFIDISGLTSSSTVTVNYITKGGKKYYDTSGTAVNYSDFSSNGTIYAKWK